MTDRKAPTRTTVAAAMWDGYRTNGVWPSQRSVANQFAVKQEIIGGIVAALERQGSLPSKHERQRHNNNVSAKAANKRLRSREALAGGHPDDLMSDAELAVLYAGRRYQDVRLVR